MPCFLKSMHGVNTDQAKAVIEKMSQGKGEEDQTGSQPESLGGAASKQDMHMD